LKFRNFNYYSQEDTYMSDKYSCFKEAVCVEVQRVFDSCRDRDCIYELPVTLSNCSADITDDLSIVRVKCVEVEDVCISVDSIPFKNGYYSVDITYKFKIVADAYSQMQACSNHGCGANLCGTAIWSKRVILYGSEGNSKVFASTDVKVPGTDCACNRMSECERACTCSGTAATAPKATLNVVDPVALEAKFICVPANAPAPGVCPPDYGNCGCGCSSCGGCGCNNCGGPVKQYKRILVVSLGLFSIISLSRPVSVIVPAYDYCVPCKDCSITSAAADAPCDVFDNIEFPTEQFFPQPSGECMFGPCCNAGESDAGCGCNCGCN
jgi:hypothetical protein